MTYAKLKQITQGKHLPAIGQNESGEHIIIEQGADDGGRFFRTTCAQSNGWVRVNTYYADGSTEELYDK